MSWSPPARKTARYALGELLRDSSNHILLLTATPHKGDPQNFTLFLQLLDPDAYADVRSIREAMDRQRAPFYLRRTKEAMVYFPEREPDGQWVARPVFTKRIPHTADFAIDGAEFDVVQLCRYSVLVVFIFKALSRERREGLRTTAICIRARRARSVSPISTNGLATLYRYRRISMAVTMACKRFGSPTRTASARSITSNHSTNSSVTLAKCGFGSILRRPVQGVRISYSLVLFGYTRSPLVNKSGTRKAPGLHGRKQPVPERILPFLVAPRQLLRAFAEERKLISGRSE